VVSDLAALVRERQPCVVLTGAGISTESGIPDFRSPSGIWAEYDPMEYGTIAAFRRDPVKVWEFYALRFQMLSTAEPNAGHLALADLEHRGLVEAVVTQNVDGLHQRAGSRRVVEVHGNLREARCAGCGTLGPIEEMAAVLRAGALPRCGRCGGLRRPNVVLFEELLPASAYEQAEAACRECGVLLVVGSSLEVHPVAGLPVLAVERGARLIIVNREETACDALADLVLRGEAGTVLPEIVRAAEGAAALPAG